MVKAKVLLHDICVDTLQNVEIPRIISNQEGDFKRKLDLDDNITYFTLLDDQKYDGKMFVAVNLKSLLLIKAWFSGLMFYARRHQ